MHINSILKRLKNPSVLVSLSSYVITILLLTLTDISASSVAAITTAILSIFTLLGVISNPDTKTKGYGDDILICPKCGKAVHVEIDGKMVCKGCGTANTD